MAKQFRSRKNLSSAQRAERAIGNTGVFSTRGGTLLVNAAPTVKDSAPNPSKELNPANAKTGESASGFFNPFNLSDRIDEAKKGQGR